MRRSSTAWRCDNSLPRGFTARQPERNEPFRHHVAQGDAIEASAADIACFRHQGEIDGLSYQIIIFIKRKFDEIAGDAGVVIFAMPIKRH